MKDYNFFISVIDDVRKSRNITIEDLTDEIISPRTYIRYVHNQQDARTLIIQKLLDRLDLKFSEVIFHYIHKASGQSDMNMFMIHFKRNHFEMCHPYYLKLKSKIDESIDYSYLIQAYLLLYELKLKIINQDDFSSQMNLLLSKVRSLPVVSMYTHYFNILYILNIENASMIFSEEFDFLLEEENISKRILQYLYLAPEVVKYMIKQEMSPNAINKLIQAHKRALIYRQDIYCESDSFYIEALFNQYTKNTKMMEEMLYKYCLIQNVIGNQSFEERMNSLYQQFHVDYHQLMRDKIKKIK